VGKFNGSTLYAGLRLDYRQTYPVGSYSHIARCLCGS